MGSSPIRSTMPYIPPSQRKELDHLIDQLAEKIKTLRKEEVDFAGLLNYTCLRLALKTTKICFGKLRYWLIAILAGIFQNISDEFYRRLGVPYEERKKEETGDLDIFEEFKD